MRFHDRSEAGRQLADRLAHLAGRGGTLVLALPRGGLPVAVEVARRLHAPLDVWCVRKLGVPGHEELAMGAIAEGDGRVVDDATCAMFDVPPAALARITDDERYELDRRVRQYREGRPAPDVRGRTVILVDDGLATGATMRAAARAVRAQGAAQVVVAVPVAPPEACALVEREGASCVCLVEPTPFFAVGAWYDAFPQLDDADVRALLAAHAAPGVGTGAG